MNFTMKSSFAIIIILVLAIGNTAYGRGRANNEKSGGTSYEDILSGELPKKQDEQDRLNAIELEKEIRKQMEAEAKAEAEYEEQQKMAQLALQLSKPIKFIGLTLGSPKNEVGKIITSGPNKMILKERIKKEGNIDYFTYRNNFMFTNAVFTGIEFWNDTLLRVTVGFNPSDADIEFESLLSGLEKQYGKFSVPEGFSASTARQIILGNCSIVITKTGEKSKQEQITIIAWDTASLKKSQEDTEKQQSASPAIISPQTP